METWPPIRLVSASNVPAGGIVRHRAHVGIVAHDVRGRINMLLHRVDDHFDFVTSELERIEVHHLVGETVLDLTRNDFAATIPRGRPNADNQAAVFIAEKGCLLAYKPAEAPHYSMLDPATGEVGPVPDYPMGILPHWRLGIRAPKDVIVWLMSSTVECQA